MNSNKLWFTKHHVWVSEEGNQTVKIGISDYAQEKLGTIVFINIPAAGECLSVGECLGDVESIKTVSDIISPVDGEVLRVNEVLLDMPDCINSDPYDSWILEVKAGGIPDDLMDEQEYAIYLRQL